MQYVVLANEKEHLLDAESDGSAHGYHVHLGDASLHCEAVFLPDGQVSLLLEGEQFLVRPAADGAQIRGHHVSAEVLDLRQSAVRRARLASGDADGPSEIQAPMTGRVARVLVSEGQAVEAGDGLVVIEAMKMENELRAPKTGIVSGLSCQAEALVELGSLVCRIE